MAKPREFWLDICTPYGDPCDFIHDEDPYVRAKRTKTHPCVSATNIHVIEYSAYEDKSAEVDEANRKLIEWACEHPTYQLSKQLEAENKIMREALESLKEFIMANKENTASEVYAFAIIDHALTQTDSTAKQEGE